MAHVLRLHWPEVESHPQLNREAELLPVPYFHVVFTLPDTLNQLAMYQPKAVYDCLFEASWRTIACFAKDPKHLGAKPGMIAILHTWACLYSKV